MQRILHYVRVIGLRIFDKSLYFSSFRIIQRLRLLEKKVEVLSQSISISHYKKFDDLAELFKIGTSIIPAKPIRLGSKFDGGYVLLDKKFENSLLISLGVGSNLDFETDWLNCKGNVVAFDGTIHSINSKIAKEHSRNFHWIQKNVNLYGDKECISINQAIELAESIFIEASLNRILKIDIESSEWDALADITEDNLLKFDQIIVEFHDILKLTILEDSRVQLCLQRLHRYFDLIWTHENNYSPYLKLNDSRIFDVIETTWHNKKSIGSISIHLDSDLKSKLNSPNDPMFPNY